MNKRILAIAKKEMLHIIRDPRSLWLAIAMPLIFIFLFSYAITFDINNVKIAVCDMDKTQKSREFISTFTASKYFTVTETTDREGDILHSLDRAAANAGIVIPPGFAKKLSRGEESKVQILVDGASTNSANIIIGYIWGVTYLYSSRVVTEFLNNTGMAIKGQVPGIEGIPINIYNPESRSRNFIIPGLIALLMSMILGILTSLTIAREKEKGTFEQLIVTPIKSYELMLGKIIPYWIIGVFDMWLIVFVGIFIYGVPLEGSILFLFITGGVFAFCALGIGLLISTIAGTQQVANQLAMLVSFLPAFILSGFLFPVKSMPKIIQFVSIFVPAKYFLTILRGVFLKGNGWEILFKETIILLVFGIILVGLASLGFKKKLT
jgi:ABC-2 type transport system permease protein